MKPRMARAEARGQGGKSAKPWSTRRVVFVSRLATSSEEGENEESQRKSPEEAMVEVEALGSTVSNA